MKLDLYRIDKEYELLFNLIEERGFDEDMEIRLNDTLHEFDTTALNVGANLKNLKARIELMRAYEKDMATKRKSLEERIEAFERFLKDNMIRFGVSKIDGVEFSVRLSAVKPRVEILTLDNADVPKKHIRTNIVNEYDKEAIRRDIEAGEDIAYAQLVPSYSLTIK